MPLAISWPRAKSYMFVVGVVYQPHCYCSEQQAVICSLTLEDISSLMYLSYTK